MLKPVVQEVHRAAELAFGQRAGEVPIRRHEYRDAEERSRQHLRLIS